MQTQEGAAELGWAIDHAAAEMFLDAFFRRRRGAGQHLGAELKAELLVLHPAALRRHPFTGADGWQRTDDRDLIAVALGFNFEHRETVFLVEKGYALDQPGEAFGKLLCRLRVQVAGMMRLLAGRVQAAAEAVNLLSPGSR